MNTLVILSDKPPKANEHVVLLYTNIRVHIVAKQHYWLSRGNL